MIGGGEGGYWDGEIGLVVSKKSNLMVRDSGVDKENGKGGREV